MFGKHFQLNDEMMAIVEEIGRHMPGGFFIYRAAPPEELLYVNHAVLDIFGCADLAEFRELTGYTFRGMLHPEDYAAISQSIEEQIDQSEDHLDYVEYRIIRKDGAVRWVDDYGHYTETEAYGGIYYVFISDITEKKERLQSTLERAQMEARQQELERRLALQEQLLEEENQRIQQKRMITALASDYRSVYYIELDKDEGICYQAHSDMDDGYQVGEHFPFAQSFLDYANNYITEPYREEFLRFVQADTIREALKEERVISYRYMVSRHGQEQYEMVRFAGVRHPEDRDDHLVHAVSACFSDVDRETRATLEQSHALAEALTAAEDANKAKTAFLSNMSHEIRTPMNAIIGLDNIALNDPDISDSTREYLEKINSSAQHLLSIINDILDMSRIESGRMTIRNEEFPFPQMLEQINTIIGGQCAEKGIEYHCQTSPALREYYIGDNMKLRQVLINILGNAVKFTPAGGTVRMGIDVVARFDGKSTIRFIVSDTGIGMSKEFLPRLFETFAQENAMATNKYGSTGLGLSITKNLVELMSGDIAVESEKGKGTTFTVTLTLGDAEHAAEPVADQKTAAPGEKAQLRGRRMLLAEDVNVNAEIMKMILAMRGMETELAENGAEALEMFQTHAPGYYDAILMDMRMPVMDGLEATRRIRSSGREDAKTIPMIALTANAFDEDVQRSMQAGLNAHLSKPVEPESLFATLESLLS